MLPMKMTATAMMMISLLNDFCLASVIFVAYFFAVPTPSLM